MEIYFIIKSCLQSYGLVMGLLLLLLLLLLLSLLLILSKNKIIFVPLNKNSSCCGRLEKRNIQYN